MSSRQEEKERRRREREEAAKAEQSKAARRKRLQMVFGIVLVVALLGGGVALAAGLLGGGSATDDVPVSAAAIPAQQEGDLKKAAAAAGCKLTDAENEGNGHEEKDFAASDYKQNPPTSGNHFPQWAQDGEYEPGDTPDLGQLVHTLEHGRINIQYKPGTDATTIARLATLFKEEGEGYHMLLYENPTGMSYAVAATAWDHQLGCPTMNDQVFDAIRAFKASYIDKGPEVVP